MSSYTDVTINSEFKNLEIATDSEAMKELLRKELRKLWGNPVEVNSLYIPRVFPRPNGGFSIQYQAGLNNNEGAADRQIIISGHLLGQNEKPPSYVLEDQKQTIFIENLGLVIIFFPFDPVLGQLGTLVSSDMYQRYIPRENASPFGENLRIKELKVMGYRLERRCSLALRTEVNENNDLTEKEIVLKLMRPKSSRRLCENLAFLQNNGFAPNSEERLTVPAVLYSDTDSGLVASEMVGGSSIHDTLDSNALVQACGFAGEIARKLHGLKSDSLRAHTASDEILELESRVAITARITPDLEPSLGASFDNLAQRLSMVNLAPITVSHRDFYDKQILCARERITLIDTDNLGVADPALDVGNFLAHLILRSLQKPTLSDALGKGGKAFADNYQRMENNWEIRVRWWQAASLIRLATLYCLRPRWRNIAPALLENALTVTEDFSTSQRRTKQVCD